MPKGACLEESNLLPHRSARKQLSHLQPQDSTSRLFTANTRPKPFQVLASNKKFATDTG